MYGLKGVVTEPSALESTALLFAHGLDLYYTRLSPSKTFDLLPDDFPHALLVRPGLPCPARLLSSALPPACMGQLRLAACCACCV